MSGPTLGKLLRPLDEKTDVNKRADGYLTYFSDKKSSKNCAELDDKRKVGQTHKSSCLLVFIRKKVQSTSSVCNIQMSPTKI